MSRESNKWRVQLNVHVASTQSLWSKNLGMSGTRQLFTVILGKWTLMTYFHYINSFLYSRHHFLTLAHQQSECSQKAFWIEDLVVYSQRKTVMPCYESNDALRFDLRVELKIEGLMMSRCGNAFKHLFWRVRIKFEHFFRNRRHEPQTNYILREITFWLFFHSPVHRNCKQFICVLHEMKAQSHSLHFRFRVDFGH